MNSNQRPQWKPTPENQVYDLKKELAKLGERGMLTEEPPECVKVKIEPEKKKAS